MTDEWTIEYYVDESGHVPVRDFLGSLPMAEEKYTQKDGRRLFEEDKAYALADPEFRAIYEAESSKKELWLQLVEARQAAGLTQQEVARRLGVSQAQVARIEKRGYESYTLKTLQRYVEALGDQFRLAIAVKKVDRSNSHATS